MQRFSKPFRFSVSPWLSFFDLRSSRRRSMMEHGGERTSQGLSSQLCSRPGFRCRRGLIAPQRHIAGQYFARVKQRERKRAIARVITAGRKTPCLPGLKAGASPTHIPKSDAGDARMSCHFLLSRPSAISVPRLTRRSAGPRACARTSRGAVWKPRAPGRCRSSFVFRFSLAAGCRGA